MNFVENISGIVVGPVDTSPASVNLRIVGAESVGLLYQSAINDLET
jgi:hypothetical protein